MTITREEILDNFSYNPNTGEFHWRVSKRGGVKKGDGAGTIYRGVSDCNYIYIMLNKKSYKAHRLAFLIMENRWPEYVDHIDGNGLNNKWENLRDVSHQDNTKNTSLRINNKSGQMGVSFSDRLGKWRASITVDYKYIHIGCFADYKEAVKARKDAERKYGFHKNHGRRRV